MDLSQKCRRRTCSKGLNATSVAPSVAEEALDLDNAINDSSCWVFAAGLLYRLKAMPPHPSDRASDPMHGAPRDHWVGVRIGIVRGPTALTGEQGL